MSNKFEIICKNVFKNENEIAFKEAYFKKWVELINLREKYKEARQL